LNNQITIIIPNFNGAHLLLKNLPSVIEAANACSEIAHIIVVDDGSSDESLIVLEQQFPDVEVVAHENNRGFAEAVHSGVHAANTELLFLLNSDVQLNAHCLDLLTDYFNESDVFSVCPLILNEKGAVTRHSWNRRQFKYGNLKPIEWDLSQAVSLRKTKKLPALYASGGSMMVRKSMFLELNGFHPLYKPFYSEDFDLGLRAWRRGWRSYFEPNVSVVHQSKGSIKENVRRAYVKQVRRRNNYILEWVHLPATRLFTTVIPLTVWQLLGELLLLDRVNLKGFITALPKIREVIAARQELKNKQRLSLVEVLKEVR
jgi:GT2 family glycosyltransferase